MSTVALTTLAVALLAYFVGRSTLPLFLARGAATPPFPLQLELLLGNTVVSVVGLLLAEFGAFTLPRLLGALALVSVAALVLRALVGRFAPAPAYGRSDAIGAALVLVAYLWAFPPLDTALFASDASVYTTAGIHLAEHGTLVIHDPTIAPLSLEQRTRWFPSYRPGSGMPPFLRVGGGFLMNDLQSDVVVSAFQPLLSVWAALFYALGGDAALTGPITYFGALFVWALASFVAGVSDVWTAGVAVGLLTSLVPQYWYSRFLMPEIPSQYFLWAGLWTAATSWTAGGTLLGALAGLALGVAGLMRLDVLIQVGAAWALWKAIGPPRAAPAGSGFAPALVAITGYAALHQVLFPTHYRVEILPRVLAVLDGLRRFHLLEGGIALLALGALAGLVAYLTRRDAGTRSRILDAGVRLVAGIAFGLYAFGIVATARPDTATNVAWLRIYVGWPMMALALIGLWFWVRATKNPTHRFVVVLAVLATAQLFFYPPVSPQPLWAIRRMLRVVVPCMAIAASLALMSVPVGRWRRPVALVGAIVVLGFGPRLAWKYRDTAYEHTMTHVRSIGALMPAGSVVLGDPAFLAESQLHVALWMTRDTPAFFVNRSDGDSLRELRTAVRDRPMYWIGPIGRMPTRSGPVRITPVATYAFAVATRRMEPWDERDDLGLRPMSLALYRVDLDETPD